MHMASIGIDLGKTTFHLVALGERNKVLLRKKFSRPQLLAYTANLPASLIGLEACAGAHFMGDALRAQGHQVRLIPAQFVKPYRKSNKNDFINAEAIAEAVTKQNMRFVQIKTQEQLDWQAMHRVRDRLMQRRTALINEIRGFLLERGLTFAVRPLYLRKNLPAVIEDAEQNLSPRLRWLLDRLWQEWKRSAQQSRGRNREQAGSHSLGCVVQRPRVSTSAATASGCLMPWKRPCACIAKKAFRFPTATKTKLEETFHQGLLRREGDDRTVQRRAGKPGHSNASLVTEGFKRTGTRGSSSSARRAILH